MDPPPIGRDKNKEKPNILESINTNFMIELSLNNFNLSIKATNKSKLDNSCFIYEGSYESITKLDRYFLMFESIEEIKDAILEILKEEKFEFKEEKDIIKIILKPKIGKLEKNIEFTLTKKEVNNDTLSIF